MYLILLVLRWLLEKQKPEIALKGISEVPVISSPARCQRGRISPWLKLTCAPSRGEKTIPLLACKWLPSHLTGYSIQTLHRYLGWRFCWSFVTVYPFGSLLAAPRTFVLGSLTGN